jgi:7-cyano-7-deazaguanine synthase
VSKAVVLLSGGLDSATTLGFAKASGYLPFAMTFRYGQRHAVEIQAASNVAKAIGVAEHVIVDIDLRLFGKSALTDGIEVPKQRSLVEMNEGIPVTYVPARNTIFLSFALAWAESLNAFDIFIGVNALDHAGYPDCRPQYIAAYEDMANLATKATVESPHRFHIHAPLLHMTKTEIIHAGNQMGIDYALTSSCYDPSDDGAACGFCDACVLRLRGFAENGLDDPIRYYNQESRAT